MSDVEENNIPVDPFAVTKQCIEDGEMEINSRVYKICKMNMKNMRKVFGYYSLIQYELTCQNFSFIGSDEYEKIQSILFSHITYNDSSLNKIDGHFEKYPEDLLLFVMQSFSVFSYPLAKGLL